MQPGPHPVTATVDLGEHSFVALPVRKGGDGHEMAVPENPDPLPKYPQLTPAVSTRTVSADLNEGVTRYQLNDDSGETEIPAADGLIVRERRHEIWTIEPDDPLSSRGEIDWLIIRRRGNWSIETRSVTAFTVTATHFVLEASVEAFENGAKVSSRNWSERIARQLM